MRPHRIECRIAAALLLVPMVATAQRDAIDERPATIRAAARVLASADARQLDAPLADSILTTPTAAHWLLLTTIRAAGQTRTTALAPRLRGLLTHPDTSVAATAAFALGLLRDTAAVSDLRAVLSRDGTVHDEAAAALRALGPGGRAVLVEALARTPSAAVLYALALVDQVPTTAIAPFLDHRDPGLRRAASYALTRAPQRDAAVALLAALDAPWMTDGTTDQRSIGDVRAAVARGLARPAVPDSLHAAARVALGRLAFDAHPQARGAAITALATYAAASPGIFQRVIAEDADPNVRVAAAQAATTPFGPDPDVWTAAWRADTSRATRSTLLQGAARHGILLGDAAGDRDTWRTHPDPRRRALFATTLLAEATEQRFERAAEFRADTSPEVQRAVVAAFARRDSTRSPEVDRWLRELARTAPDPWVRATAIRGVAANAPADLVPTLIAAYERAVADVAPGARQAILTLLTAQWERDSAALTPWVAAMGRWPVPPEAGSRVLGGRLPVLRHWTRGSDALGQIADWEHVVRTIVLPSLQGTPLRATLTTERGTIVVALAGAVAPATVANLRALAGRGYFDGVEWHRVVPNFVVQTGDPSGTGSGGPGYSIRDEINRLRYERGTVGMALSGPDTGGSQWFITFTPQPHLDAAYTVFGHVVSGLDVVDATAQWDRIVTVRVQ